MWVFSIFDKDCYRVHWENEKKGIRPFIFKALKQGWRWDGKLWYCPSHWKEEKEDKKKEKEDKKKEKKKNRICNECKEEVPSFASFKGWTRVKKSWYCPSHQKEGEEAKEFVKNDLRSHAECPLNRAKAGVNAFGRGVPTFGGITKHPDRYPCSKCSRRDWELCT